MCSSIFIFVLWKLIAFEVLTQLNYNHFRVVIHRICSYEIFSKVFWSKKNLIWSQTKKIINFCQLLFDEEYSIKKRYSLQ